MRKPIYGYQFFPGLIQFVMVIGSDVKQRQGYSQRQNPSPRFSSLNSMIDFFALSFHLGDKARSDKKKITQPRDSERTEKNK